MSDDSFIREVEEELRSDRFKALWKRFGPLIIGGAVLIVAVTAAWNGWQAYTRSQANASGDVFLSALERAEDGDTDAALALLEELREEGAGRYDLLATMRAAAILAQSDPRAAIDGFSAVAADPETPPSIRAMASIRAAYLAVDHGTLDEANALVGAFAVEASPVRHSAREVLGLANFKAGERERAAEWFQAIIADEATPPGIEARAREMLALMRSQDPSDTVVTVPAAALEPAPTGEAAIVPSEAATPDGTVTVPVTPAPAVESVTPGAPVTPVAPSTPDASPAPNAAAPAIAPAEPISPTDGNASGETLRFETVPVEPVPAAPEGAAAPASGDPVVVEEPVIVEEPAATDIPTITDDAPITDDPAVPTDAR